MVYLFNLFAESNDIIRRFNIHVTYHQCMDPDMRLVKYIDKAINSGGKKIPVPARLLKAASPDGRDAASKLCKLNKVEMVVVSG